MLIARLAWDQMTPEQRASASELLKALPHYDDLLVGKPENYDVELYAFMRAATWPDMIRSDKHPMHAEHHPYWHFINLPINRDGVSGPTPETQWDGTSDPTNIVQALAKCESDLKNKDLPAERRAIAMCWVLHLVGDLHQPLHAVALFSKDFPNGDRGGNDFMVSDNGRITALHSYWDGIFGNSTGAKEVQRLVDAINENPKLTREALAAVLEKHTTPTEWTSESADLARRFAYAELQGVTREVIKLDPSHAAPELPAGYAEASRRVADELAALAGYRLGDETRALLH
jgi:hypothetical protein